MKDPLLQITEQILRNASSVFPIVVLFLLSSLLSSCSIWETDNWNRGFGFEDDDVPERATGPRPIYARSDAYDIFSDVPRVISNGIAVFENNDFLFTVDADLGIHIEDNSNPSSPRRLAFVTIPGVRTASADLDRLYANNFVDLVTIDISNPEEVRVVSRQENFYESPAAFPPNYSGPFECYDASKGPLLGWETVSLTRPQCRIQ